MKYNKPTLDVIKFDENDVIMASNNTLTDFVQGVFATNLGSIDSSKIEDVTE